MRFEDAVQAHKKMKEEMSFEPLRERRILSGVMSRHRKRPAQGTVLRYSFAALALAVVVIFGVFYFSPFHGVEAGKTESAFKVGERDFSKTDPAAVGKPSVLKLKDGSSAVLLSSADVEVDGQSENKIELTHGFGRVRYEVTKKPARDFIVHVCGVDIRVIGTVFVVEADPANVSVTVEEGLVEVRDGNRVIPLGVGEEILLARAPDGSAVLEKPDIDSHAPLGEGADKKGSRAPDGGATIAKASSFEALLARADEARRSGDHEAAARALNQLVRSYSKDSRIVSVLFSLGKVESRLGKHRNAARAFRSCRRWSPRGTLAEDAHAQEAQAWKDSGLDDRARQVAGTYLRLYVNGPYTEKMKKLIE